jgi:hypothetical protein
MTPASVALHASSGPQAVPRQFNNRDRQRRRVVVPDLAVISIVSQCQQAPRVTVLRQSRTYVGSSCSEPH